MPWLTLTIGFVTLIVGGVVTFTAANYSTVGIHGRLKGENVAELAEQNAVELFRAEMIDVMRKNGLNSRNLREEMKGGSTLPWANYLVEGHNVFGVAGSQTAVEAVSNANASVHQLDARFTIADVRQIASSKPSLSRRESINFGSKSVFDNAVTLKRAECIFCHVNIYGDVAEYAKDTVFSYKKNDKVHGTWYALGKARDMDNGTPSTDNVRKAGVTDNASPQLPVTSLSVPTIFNLAPYGMNPYTTWNSPGVTKLTVRDYKTNYQGPKLPWNFQRQAHILPKFDPASMLYLASGRACIVTAGNPVQCVTPVAHKIVTVPFGGLYNANDATQVTSALNGIIEGNVVLRGTAQFPIRIDGNVFVRGDLLIGGVIAGVGAFYSGRNIYVTENLTYLNRPTGLNGSAASNQALTLVSYCQDSITASPCDCETGKLIDAPLTACVPVKNAQLLTNAWKAEGNFDQLMLVATNNIVIGDPFPDPTNGREIQPRSFVYASRAVLAPHAGEFAFDKETGYVLDYEDGAFIYPWAKTGSYVPPTRVLQRSQTYKYAWGNGNPDPTHPGLNGFGTEHEKDSAYFLDQKQFAPSEAFVELFHPRNPYYDTNASAWSFRGWIQPSEFRAITANPLPTPDPFGRRSRSKLVQLPSVRDYPYTPERWQTGTELKVDGKTEGIVKSIEDLTNVFSQARDGKTGNGPQRVYVNTADLVGKTLESSVSEFFAKTRLGAMAMGFSGDGRTRTQFPVDVPFGEAFIFVADYKFDSQYCWNSSSTSPNPADHTCDCTQPGSRCGRVYVTIGASYFGMETCDPVIGYCWLYCAEIPAGMGSYDGNAVPTCQTGAPPDVVAGDVRSGLTANDLKIRVAWHYDWADIRRFTLDTNYWDANRLAPRNAINNVDSFLFTNQFVFYGSDSSFDNDLTIRGGVASKDMAGYFANDLKQGPASSFTMGDGTFNVAPLKGSAPFGFQGLTVMLDPRIQFYTDFLYSDFGRLLPRP